MRVVCVFLIVVVAACYAAPGSSNEEPKVELFSGVSIEKDEKGEDKLNVKFEPGELREAARTFEEARGKIKKYSPLIAGLGVKVLAIAGLLFGGLTLLVTKALVVAKLAFLVAAALGLQKLLAAGSLNSTIGKDSPVSPQIASFQTSPQQWANPTAAGSSYPYARSSNIGQDPNDLAYKAQIPSAL